jgi:hypothetical protein
MSFMLYLPSTHIIFPGAHSTSFINADVMKTISTSAGNQILIILHIVCHFLD